MPPAVLAWVDYSQADQRRAREIVAMFSQRESRDELGLGRIRDALSETLFPGTSVLLTRARYLLLVPWLFGGVPIFFVKALVPLAAFQRAVELDDHLGDHTPRHSFDGDDDGLRVEASATAAVSAFARRGERFRTTRAMPLRPASTSAWGAG